MRQVLTFMRMTGGQRVLLAMAMGLALVLVPARPRPTLAQSGTVCSNAPPIVDYSAPPALIKELITRVPGLLGPYISGNVVPSITVGVIYDQKLIYAIGVGCANVANRTPAGPGTVYRIEAVTKLFEATMMMQQRDAGLYQTSSAVISPSPSQTVTQPRAYQYSDLGNVAMSQAVALLAGYNNNGGNQAYHQYVTDRILQPLGMTASTFNYQSVPAQNLAQPYDKSGNTWVVNPKGFEFSFPLAGDVFSSIQDMAKLVSLEFRTGPAGGSHVLACSSLQEMWVPVAPTTGTSHVGTGWFILQPPPGVTYPVLSKDGGSPWFAALVRMIPQLRIGIVAFANYAGTGVGATALSNLETAMLQFMAPALPPNPPVCAR